MALCRHFLFKKSDAYFSYEVRVIVWSTSDVPPSETSITGDEMNDMYVKGENRMFSIGNFQNEKVLFATNIAQRNRDKVC